MNGLPAGWFTRAKGRAMNADEKLRHELLAKIHEQVEFEPGDDTHFVRLTVLYGVATIDGVVPSLVDKADILRILAEQRGVIGWTEGLTVKVPEEHRRADAEIAEAARGAILEITTNRPDTIHITVQDGWAYLEGTVEHWSQREAAEYAVRCLTGLRGVMNLIWAAEHCVPGTSNAQTAAT